MFDKRLFSLVPGLKGRIAAKVACMWVNLLANIALVFTVVSLIGSLLNVADRHAPQLHVCIPGSGGKCIDLMALANAYWFIGQDRDLIWQTFWPAGMITTYLIIFLCIAVIKLIATQLSARFGTTAAEDVKLTLREALYRKMLSLGPSYRQRVKTSDIVQSAGEGIDQIQSFYELFLPQLFYAVLAPITLFCVVAPINMPTAVVLLICAPLIVIIVGVVAMSASRAFKHYWGQYTDMGALFLDDMSGLETLKNFDADEDAAMKMDDQSERFRETTMKVLQIQLRSLTAMDVVAYGGVAAGIGTAVWQYVHNGATNLHLNFGIYAFLNGPYLTVAGVLIVILLSADFFIPLRQLGSYFHVAMNGMTSTKRIFSLLDTPEPERGTVDLELEDGDGLELRLKGVAFSYDDIPSQQGNVGAVRAAIDKAHDHAPNAVPIEESHQTEESVPMALTDITFTAVPGTITTIVGKSGSGKTTLAEILTGRLAGYRGLISVQRVHGTQEPSDPYAQGTSVELGEITVASLSKSIGMVSATSRLFTGTLRSNLEMARPNATDDEMMDALHRAHIDEFVRANGGLDFQIAPDAGNLSGGQHQRIAMARVLLQDAPVIIFDEITSSVDSDSETLLNDTIHELAKTKTIIQITHRLANTTHANQIVVIDNGRSVETGTHDELMAQNGLYAQMFRTQANVEAVGRRKNADGKPSGIEYGAAVTAFGNDTHATTKKTTDSHNTAASDASATQTPLTDTQVVQRLLGMVRPLRSHMILACVCGTVGHLAATMVPVFGAMALFIATGNKVWGMGMSLAITLMVICALIRGFMRYAEQYMNHNVAFRLLALFRHMSFDALRRLAPARLVRRGKGDLVALITTDVELLEIFFAHTISPIVIALATSVLYIVAALALFNPATALLMIVAYLILGVGLPQLFRVVLRRQGTGTALRAEAAALNDQMLDDMRGLSRIIHFGQGEQRLAMLMNRSRALRANYSRLSSRNGTFAGIASAFIVIFTAIAAFLCISTSIANPVNIAFNVTAFVLFVSSFGPVLALSALPGTLTQTFAAARRLFALQDETPAVVDDGTCKPQYDGMTMMNVTFAYPHNSEPDMQPMADEDMDMAAFGGSSLGPGSASGSGVWRTRMQAQAPHVRRANEQGKGDVRGDVLDNFSVDIPVRGILGIQGATGRGKSTMLKLLMRYWDPQQGKVYLSNTPLPDVDAHTRRREQTMMNQETFLFDGTIRENLQLADGGATDERLREALRKASALELVDSLPHGLDTQVGELGGRLSEGERQRIGLARVFLRRSNLILLDEPASRLDALNEAYILQSINELASEQQVAIVLVSHRKSTMRVCDKVYCLCKPKPLLIFGNGLSGAAVKHSKHSLFLSGGHGQAILVFYTDLARHIVTPVCAICRQPIGGRRRSFALISRPVYSQQIIRIVRICYELRLLPRIRARTPRVL